MANQPAIDIQNVSFSYDKSTAVDHVSFRVPKKSTVMLIGPNGSGKTTLLKLMVGLLEPTKGTVKIYGKSPKQSRALYGYVPQKLNFDQSFPLTVKEFLTLTLTTVDSNNLQKTMRSLDIETLANKQVGALSGGQLQRVLIARSLLGDPKILFLDEPASGIDVGGEQSFYELIKDIQQQRDVTVVMVSHQIQLVSQFADQVVCINKKMLSSGKPHKALKPEMIEKLFGEKVALHEHNHQH